MTSVFGIRESRDRERRGGDQQGNNYGDGALCLRENMTQRTRSNKPDRGYRRSGFTEDDEEDERASYGTDCHVLYNIGANLLLRRKGFQQKIRNIK